LKIRENHGMVNLSLTSIPNYWFCCCVLFTYLFQCNQKILF